jgi:hypothetical protein
MPILVAYDNERLHAILRDWSVDQLRWELDDGLFASQLSHHDQEELRLITVAWSQRALSAMPLRDALLIDPVRGRRANYLLGLALTEVTCNAAPPELLTLAHQTSSPLELQHLRQSLVGPQPSCLDHCLEQAEQQSLYLAWAAQDNDELYPYPDLNKLLPEPPHIPSTGSFEQPRGLRRAFAMSLVLLGSILLVWPLLLGRLPEQPAGLPLALMTVALLIGIRAGSAGYLGAGCIWAVANLPTFHYGTLIDLWPALPLLIIGVILLALDRRVRLMWRWIRRRQRNDITSG